MHNAFTIKHDGIARSLITKASICLPHTQEELNKKIEDKENIDFKEYNAIWDTGATGCVITKKVVEELDLKPIGVADVNHAAGVSKSNIYLVGISLPNKVVQASVQVTEGVLPDGAKKGEAAIDILIGMNIIAQGDFAITNKEGKTMMSFKLPSTEEIDFVPLSEEKNIQESGNNRAARRAMKKNLKKKYKK